jgi:hypothetical protein
MHDNRAKDRAQEEEAMSNNRWQAGRADSQVPADTDVAVDVGGPVERVKDDRITALGALANDGLFLFLAALHMSMSA